MTIATFPARPGQGGAGHGTGCAAGPVGDTKPYRTGDAGSYLRQRATKRSALAAAGGFAAGLGVEIALTIRALRSGCKVLEVATEMDHRVTGRSLKISCIERRNCRGRRRSAYVLWLHRTGYRPASKGNASTWVIGAA